MIQYGAPNLYTADNVNDIRNATLELLKEITTFSHNFVKNYKKYIYVRESNGAVSYCDSNS